jgi:uncharacterized membrane protein YciS (DUF1049 family)
MFALSLVVLALVAVMVVASFLGGTDEVIIEFANVTITTSVGGVFVAGVLAGVVALISIVALKISIQRLRQRNREVRELRRRAELAAPARPAADRPESDAGQRAREPAGAETSASDTVADGRTRPASDRETTGDDERS